MRRQVARAKDGRKLQPVLADAVCTEATGSGKNACSSAAQFRRAAWWEMVCREFEAEAEIVGGLFAPARNDLRFRERIEGGVTLDAVEVAGIIRQVTQPDAVPGRMLPLRQSDVDHGVVFLY